MNDEGPKPNDVPQSAVVYTAAAVLEGPQQLYAQQALPIHVPQDEADDKVVQIRGSKLIRCRELAEQVGKDTFDWFSLAGIIGAAGAGGLLGGWASGLGATSAFNTLYYVVSTAFFVAGVTLGWAVRKFKKASDAERAAEILRMLPVNLLPATAQPNTQPK